MRTTLFAPTDDGGVRTTVVEDPELVPMAEWDGQPLTGVRWFDIETRGDIELQLVEIAAGGHFVMHASPKLAFCHVVRGAGMLGLPGGESRPYRGPETYVFHPHALHDWHDVTEDTLLAVAIVPDHA